MKKLTLSVLILAVFVSSAQAQDLKLLGRGLQKRGTAETIALACVDESCTQAQFVYFDGPGQPHWIGSKIVIPTAPTEDLKEQATKLKVGFYLANSEKAIATRSEGQSIRKNIGWIVMGASVIMVPLIGTTIAFLANGATAFFVVSFPPRTLDSILVGSGELVIAAQSNQRNGWNWSASPKSVSKKVFNNLLDSLNENLQVDRSQIKIKVYTDDRLQSRFRRKMKKLEVQGVDFDPHVNDPQSVGSSAP